MADRGDIDLNRFWNEILAGVGDALADDLDPESAALIRRMHALANAPLPVSARERVWRGLLDTYVSIAEPEEQTMLTAIDVSPPRALRLNGHAPRVRLVVPPSKPAGWWLRPVTWVAAAALMIAFAGGFIADRLIGGNDSEPSRGGPAILAPASPSPEAIVDELLVEILVPANLLPIGEPALAGTALVIVPVGTFQQSPDEAAKNPGVQASYILEGTASVVSDELMHLINSGSTGTVEEIEAATQVVLEPGDTLITRKSPGEVWTNQGPAEVRLISLEVFGGLRRSLPGRPAGPPGILSTIHSTCGPGTSRHSFACGASPHRPRLSFRSRWGRWASSPCLRATRGAR